MKTLFNHNPLVLILICCCTVACVSKSKYKALQKDYLELSEKEQTVVQYAADTKRDLNKLQDEYADLQNRATTGSNTCKQQLQLLVDSLQRLKIGYENQLKMTSSNISGQAQKYQAYEQQLVSQKRQQDALIARNQVIVNYLMDSLVAMDTANIQVEQRQNRVYLLFYNKMVRASSTLWDAANIVILSKLSNFLNQNADLQLVIIGHSAKRTALLTNMETAQARANALALFLMEKGISSKRIFTSGRTNYDLALGINVNEQKLRNECVEIRISTEKLGY